MKNTQNEELGAASMAKHVPNISVQRSSQTPTKRSSKAPLSYQDLDQFKFRIVERDGLHYFKEVRFNVLHVNNSDKNAIVEFFEGRELEALLLTDMDAALIEVGILPKLKELVFDLQSVLCS